MCSSVKLEQVPGRQGLALQAIRTRNKSPGSRWAKDGRHLEKDGPAQEGCRQDTTRTHNVRAEGLHVGLAAGTAREGPYLGFMLESRSHLQKQNGRLNGSNFRSGKISRITFYSHTPFGITELIELIVVIIFFQCLKKILLYLLLIFICSTQFTRTCLTSEDTSRR